MFLFYFFPTLIIVPNNITIFFLSQEDEIYRAMAVINVSVCNGEDDGLMER